MRNLKADGWAALPLGEVCDVLDRLRKPITKADRVAGPFPYFGATGVLDHVADYIFDEPLVLIGEDGAKWGAGDNSAFSISGKTWVNNHAHVLRPHRDKILDDWLIYYLNAQDLSDFVSGMTVPKLNQGRMREIPIPLPPLEEQRRIVAVLDEAFEGLARARAHAEANLQNARELFLSALQSAFDELQEGTWEPVGKVADHCLGKMLDKRKNKGIPREYLRNLNVRWFALDTSDLLEMRIEDSEAERYSVRRGDLLICEGGYPGRSAIWDHDDPIFFQKALHRVRFSHQAYAYLLMFYLFLQDQKGDLRNHFTGAGIQHFTGKALAKYLMPFPAPEVAEATIHKLEAVQARSEELVDGFSKRLLEIEELRQAILRKAFAGELTQGEGGKRVTRTEEERVTHEIVEAALRRRGEDPTPDEIRRTNPWLLGNLTKEEAERQSRYGKPHWPQDLD